MRIAIDARLNAYRIGGIPQYTRRLASAMAALAPDDTFLTLQHREHQTPLVVAENVVRKTLYTPPHHRWESFALPVELLPLRAKVVHFPDFIAPPFCTAKTVITIHDLAFLRYPEILDASARAYYGQIQQSVKRAHAIIAVSEATRRDIVEFLKVAPERVDLIYEAAAPEFSPLEIPAGATRNIGGISVAAQSFLLFVSTIEPRKNLQTLLQALRLCLDRQPEQHYRLVIVGPRGWRDEAVFNAIRDLKLADQIDLVGKVDDDELRWLYSACRLYANPSLYEGFGLPLLEAMACGAACLASQTSSLPEIGGEVVHYLPAQDASAWADAIAALWADPVERANLGRRGVVRASQFSWLRAARETLALYRRIAG